MVGDCGPGYSLPPASMCVAACYAEDGGVGGGGCYGGYGFEV